MELLTPKHWKDYELLDCGDFEKLERFGQFITIRPEPQAVWKKVHSYSEWEKKAHIKFVPRSSSSGDWKVLKKMPEQNRSEIINKIEEILSIWIEKGTSWTMNQINCKKKIN
jgi:23S rRNA (cytosine1962-C5)-methyltransferase